MSYSITSESERRLRQSSVPMFLPDSSLPVPSPSFAARRRARLSAGFSLAMVVLTPALVARAAVKPAQAPQQAPVLLDAMTAELHRAFSSLGKAGPGATGLDKTGAGKTGDDKQQPPYFLSYSVSDASAVTIRAQYGALVESSANQARVGDVQVRVGDPKLDNTHGDHRASAVNSVQLPLSDDREALVRTLWAATNTGYGNALDNYLRVKTESQVRAKEEDTSPDFSQEPEQTHVGDSAPTVSVDRAAWEERVRSLSKVFRDYPDVYQNMVMLTAQSETDYFASSEGSKIVTPHTQA